ncbi:hydroxysqualene dehydroxylase HpnE [Kutzneria viridogrisea]|uniref:Amine oxidase domain-containing protein n=2 Tax=Kutzneria TaxID=43356 RepID=W5W9H5_9PSEU|nr:hydroxysqualene dehydroxylase HpnE [Kutzneria albida]AHH97410.1 hypothetical protein KALB_4046 [Kutzneria albida DSM 43870]MBA8930672.1 squalene-associated FAD-dependent desaturase [Kutzneria viridogrisea]
MTGHVAVIGGGLAGLTAACDLADEGLRVTVLEARRRLGGATFTFHLDGLEIDNGQHVVLRCYTQYLNLLRRLGSAHALEVQRQFDVPVLRPGVGRTRLRRARVPAPLHLLTALARYRALSVPQRLRAVRAAAALRGLDPAEPALDEISFGRWLDDHGQGGAPRAALWDLISVAALNCPSEHASLGLAAMVFRTALLDHAAAADIGVPTVPLDQVHVLPAERYVTARGGAVHTNCPVRAVRVDRRGFHLFLDQRRLLVDAVVVATTPIAAAAVCPSEANLIPADLHRLGSSPIVNVHVVFSEPVTDLRFAAAVSSPVQWLFDRSGPAGLEHGQYLAVSLSAAQRWISAPVSRLREVFLPALGTLLPAAARTSVTRFFVTRHRRATFQQRPGTARLRPEPATSVPGLVLAGAWTATGWPDTMEGAVRSGHEAAGLVRRHLGGDR